eukprot:sb/3479044/
MGTVQFGISMVVTIIGKRGVKLGKSKPAKRCRREEVTTPPKLLSVGVPLSYSPINPLRTITIGRTEFSNFLWRRSGEYSKIIRKGFTEIGFLLFEL